MKVKNLLTSVAFAVARSTPGKRLAGWAFAHLSFALPVRRTRETPNLLAFYHPKPSSPLHILIVPKRAIPGLESLGEQDSGLLLEIFQMTGELVQDLGLQGEGTRLVVNGGKYQDIPQLHFHLVCDSVSEETSRS